jgi:hypothetical protein
MPASARDDAMASRQSAATWLQDIIEGHSLRAFD